VKWAGYGAVDRDSKSRAGMKPSGAGKYWVPKEYDPDYTPSRDISPKRAYLDKHGHPSDRCRTSLRVLWGLTEEETMVSLIDGGFLTDTCLGKDGRELPCKGILGVSYYSGKQEQRGLCCTGVSKAERHRMHWLCGSVFQGHTKLNAGDVSGLLSCFASSKNIEATSMDIGLSRDSVGPLFDRLRMAATLVVQDQREHLVFEDCQVEADETVVRKEKVYDTAADGARRRVGTRHHSVITLTQRGSTRQVCYLMEPRFVPVDSRGKPSPPALPSVELVLPMLSKHFGKHVVLHTDGADAYRSACEQLKKEGYSVVQDHVVHSQGQYTAFGRHDVSGDPGWEGCTFAQKNSKGERRIRVIKGCQKAEGLWRHLKHGNAAVPEEVHNDDERLNMYTQALVWRMQTCGCPYRDVLRMCRAFRSLPLEQKNLVYQYGLRSGESRKPCTKKPPVTYCSWTLSSEVDDEEDEA
jgi:hypothetical protein